MKGKIYKTVERPAMLYVMESVAITKRQKAEIQGTELKVLPFPRGVTRLYEIIEMTTLGGKRMCVRLGTK